MYISLQGPKPLGEVTMKRVSVIDMRGKPHNLEKTQAGTENAIHLVHPAGMEPRTPESKGEDSLTLPTRLPNYKRTIYLIIEMFTFYIPPISYTHKK